MTKQSSKIGKIVYLSAIGMLVITFLLLVLEKSQLTDFYTKPVDTTVIERPINDIDYSPPTQEQQQEVDQTKQQLIENANKPPATVDSIIITLSAAGQDTNGGPLIVKAIINGASSGTCNLTLINSSVSKSYEAEVVNLGTYYSCDGFEIPVSDLSDGQWQLTLNVISGNLFGSITQPVEVVL